MSQSDSASGDFAKFLRPSQNTYMKFIKLKVNKIYCIKEMYCPKLTYLVYFVL